MPEIPGLVRFGSVQTVGEVKRKILCFLAHFFYKLEINYHTGEVKRKFLWSVRLELPKKTLSLVDQAMFASVTIFNRNNIYSLITSNEGIIIN